jgi:hypothetical protein
MALDCPYELILARRVELGVVFMVGHMLVVGG